MTFIAASIELSTPFSAGLRKSQAKDRPASMKKAYRHQESLRRRKPQKPGSINRSKIKCRASTRFIVVGLTVGKSSPRLPTVKWAVTTTPIQSVAARADV
jgi:hypothetical protein